MLAVLCWHYNKSGLETNWNLGTYLPSLMQVSHIYTEIVGVTTALLSAVTSLNLGFRQNSLLLDRALIMHYGWRQQVRLGRSLPRKLEPMTTLRFRKARSGKDVYLSVGSQTSGNLSVVAFRGRFCWTPGGHAPWHEQQELIYVLSVFLAIWTWSLLKICQKKRVASCKVLSCILAIVNVGGHGMNINSMSMYNK